MDQFSGLFLASLALWVALCGAVYIVNRSLALKLAWLPLRLTRRAVGWVFIELGRAIAGSGKK